VVKLSTSQRSPLSPTRWPPDAFLWWRSLLVAALVILAAVAGAVAGALVVRAATPVPHTIPNKLTWGITLGQLITYVPIMAVIVSFLPWAARRSLAALGFRRLDGRSLSIALIGAVTMYVVTLLVAALLYLITHSQPHEEAVELFTSTHDTALIVVFALIAVVAAPIVEESVFRGLVFNALLRYTPVWLAATISGILFGLTHYSPNTSPSALITLACTGVVLAYVYYTSGSLTAAMVTHGLFNAVNLAALASGQK
jgi:membrane protease YdiL (CAAX protease family)